MALLKQEALQTAQSHGHDVVRQRVSENGRSEVYACRKPGCKAAFAYLTKDRAVIDAKGLDKECLPRG